MSFPALVTFLLETFSSPFSFYRVHAGSCQAEFLTAAFWTASYTCAQVLSSPGGNVTKMTLSSAWPSTITAALAVIEWGWREVSRGRGSTADDRKDTSFEFVLCSSSAGRAMNPLLCFQSVSKVWKMKPLPSLETLMLCRWRALKHNCFTVN